MFGSEDGVSRLGVRVVVEGDGDEGSASKPAAADGAGVEEVITYPLDGVSNLGGKSAVGALPQRGGALRLVEHAFLESLPVAEGFVEVVERDIRALNEHLDDLLGTAALLEGLPVEYLEMREEATADVSLPHRDGLFEVPLDGDGHRRGEVWSRGGELSGGVLVGNPLAGQAVLHRLRSLLVLLSLRGESLEVRD